jgi:molybdopterin converting factor small subunit
MAQVHLRLFGLGKGAASKARLTQALEPGTTVKTLWEDLRRDSGPGDNMATIDREGLLVLVNGRPIRFLAGWETQVVDNDSVSFMPKAFGG